VQTHEGGIVLTTEKDAVKIRSLLTFDDPWWALRLGARVAKGEAHLRRLIDVSPTEGVALEPHA
jgi:tetraacyldisaccharide-1-P 4'-kinase